MVGTVALAKKSPYRAVSVVAEITFSAELPAHSGSCYPPSSHIPVLNIQNYSALSSRPSCCILCEVLNRSCITINPKTLVLS
jgi:hypothetical protein